MATSDPDHPHPTDADERTPAEILAERSRAPHVRAARCRVWRDRCWSGESITAIAEACAWERSTVARHVRCNCDHDHPEGWRSSMNREGGTDGE